MNRNSAPRAALILLATAAVALASRAPAQQGGPTPPPPNIGPGVGQPPVRQGPFQNPQATFDPRFGNGFMFDPRFNTGGGFNSGTGFNSPFLQGVPDQALWPGGWWPGWRETVTTGNNYPNGIGGRAARPMPGSGVPTLGINVRPGTYNTRRTRVSLKTLYGAGADVAADRKLHARNGGQTANRTPAATAAGPRSGATDPLVKRRASDIMDRQALTTARVVSAGPAQAQLRYTVNGKAVTATVPLSKIFYFGANGELLLAAEHPTRLGRGDEVLAPAPARERVAGSRRTIAKAASTAKRR